VKAGVKTGKKTLISNVVNSIKTGSYFLITALRGRIMYWTLCKHKANITQIKTWISIRKNFTRVHIKKLLTLLQHADM